MYLSSVSARRASRSRSLVSLVCPPVSSSSPGRWVMNGEGSIAVTGGGIVVSSTVRSSLTNDVLGLFRFNHAISGRVNVCVRGVGWFVVSGSRVGVCIGGLMSSRLSRNGEGESIS